MSAAASSFPVSLLITAPPSSQHNNNHRGIATFGLCLISGKLVLRCSSRDDKRAFAVDAASETLAVPSEKEEDNDSTDAKGIKENTPYEKKRVNFSKISTQLLNIDNIIGDPHNASSIPIYQTATFKQKSLDDFGKAYLYTRDGNPTRTVLESILAKLDNANDAFCFTSGMAALTAVTHIVKDGEEIVASLDLYGGSDHLLNKMIARTGVVVKRVDMSDFKQVRDAINEKTKLVWLESPSNPRIGVYDIRKIADITHEKGMKAVKGRAGAWLMVDNSIMSPVLSRPMELNADIVVHSATKFISGHSDVMAGVVAVNDKSLAEELKGIQMDEGSGLSPFDSWVCLRGLKTIALRIEKQQANAQKIAEFLYKCEKDEKSPVKKVNYVGLPSYPGHKLHFEQAYGAGSVLSFTTGSVPTSIRIVNGVKLFGLTVSFGNVKSLISMPGYTSNNSITEEVRIARGLVDDLIRISVGIEDVDELIDDLRQALEECTRVSGKSVLE